MLGIDPVAAAMAESARRAAAPPRKGGLANAAFVVAASEALPDELAAAGVVGLADRVTVNLPWGSLLRGALALDPAAARGIAALVRCGGRVEMLLAPAPRDVLAADVDVQARVAGSMAADWWDLGLELVAAQPATAGEVDATRTTWARRLGLTAGRTPERVPWRVVLRRP